MKQTMAKECKSKRIQLKCSSTVSRLPALSPTVCKHAFRLRAQRLVCCQCNCRCRRVVHYSYSWTRYHPASRENVENVDEYLEHMTGTYRLRPIHLEIYLQASLWCAKCKCPMLYKSDDDWVNRREQRQCQMRDEQHEVNTRRFLESKQIMTKRRQRTEGGRANTTTTRKGVIAAK